MLPPFRTAIAEAHTRIGVTLFAG